MKTLLLCLISAHLSASAAGLDQHEKKGLEDTQKMLTTPEARKEAIKNDKRAKEVDEKVDALAGPENKEEIYSIASKVMERITIEANGNPEKMQQLLLEAQSNPQAFYQKYFSEEQKAAVRGVATKIEKKKAPVPSK